MSSEQEAIQDIPLTWRARVVDYLGLERNVAVASAAVFLLGLGEELWKKFLPKYLESLGASTLIIGLFGTAKDFFDAIYQYPGGWLADRVGRRRAFLIFIALASLGRDHAPRRIDLYPAGTLRPLTTIDIHVSREPERCGGDHTTSGLREAINFPGRRPPYRPRGKLGQPEATIAELLDCQR